MAGFSHHSLTREQEAWHMGGEEAVSVLWAQVRLGGLPT